MQERLTYACPVEKIFPKTSESGDNRQKTNSRKNIAYKGLKVLLKQTWNFRYFEWFFVDFLAAEQFLKDFKKTIVIEKSLQKSIDSKNRKSPRQLSWEVPKLELSWLWALFHTTAEFLCSTKFRCGLSILCEIPLAF